MAHFAKLDENNVVTAVEAVANAVITDENGVEQEQLGVDFLKTLYKEPDAVWKKTSYNTREGTHRHSMQARVESDTQDKAFRKNYAGIGYTYDEVRDAFIPQPKPFASWVLNETKCVWEAPVAFPITNDTYFKDLNGNYLTKIITNPDLTIKQVSEVDIFLHATDPYNWDESSQSWVREPMWNSPITAEQQTQFETVNADYLNSL